MPFLSSIWIYPIKSLDGVSIAQATILEGGILKWDSPQPAYSCEKAGYGDREFAIFDQQGRFVNGKRVAKVHQLRSYFDATARIVSLQVQGMPGQQVFQVDRERTEIEAWLSRYFGFSVTLRQNQLTGFPDDTDASGPTIISTGTLEAVASWFPELSTNDLRLRLRANIEIGGVPPFWEDQLFTAADSVVLFQIGEVQFIGSNPCQRCVVPTRDPITGEVYPHFQKTFVAKRKEALPSWATVSRFNHFFRLAVNTRVPKSEAGKILRAGDSVKILGVSKVTPELTSHFLHSIHPATG